VKPHRSAGRGHSLFVEQVNNSRLGGLCTDQSSDLDVDHNHGGASKAGSTGRLARRAKVSVSSWIRATEEGATSRRGVWRLWTSAIQTVELSRKRVVSKPHSNYEQGTPKATDPEIGGMSWHPSCHSAEVALQ